MYKERHSLVAMGGFACVLILVSDYSSGYAYTSKHVLFFLSVVVKDLH